MHVLQWSCVSWEWARVRFRYFDVILVEKHILSDNQCKAPMHIHMHMHVHAHIQPFYRDIFHSVPMCLIPFQKKMPFSTC